MILRRTQSEYNQNMVVQALIDLEKRGLVERTTSKAWIAKASASSYLED
jgi:DNA-binding HxlR family transcriptional regulator